MPRLNLIRCASCGSGDIREVGHHNLRCADCGMTGSNEDIWGEGWNHIQTLLWKDKGINPRRCVIPNKSIEDAPAEMTADEAFAWLKGYEMGFEEAPDIVTKRNASESL